MQHELQKPRTRQHFYTTEEAAAFLHLSPKTLANMREKEIGPAFHKFETAIRYERHDLTRYARKSRHSTRSDR